MDDELMEFIAEAYTLEPIHTYKKIELGYLSHNYVLEAGTRHFFLKQYRYTDPERIEQIHAAKRFFSDGGIPVILPFMARAGKRIVMYRDLYYSLFPFIEDRIIPREDITVTALQSAGSMLGRMHLLSQDGFKPIVPTKKEAWSKKRFYAQSQKLLDIINTKTRPDAFDMLAKEAITYKLKLLREDAQSHKALQLSADHLLHGDYHELNLFFDTNDQVTYVFDFEKACIGPRLSELVRSMNIMCFNTFYEKRNFALAREYVRAYDEVYSIKKEEFAKALRAGYNRMKYSLWVEEFHYLEEDTRSDVFLKIGLDTLRWLDEHHQAFEEEVLSWV